MTSLKCVVEGCFRTNIRARGLCNAHYQLARNSSLLEDYASKIKHVGHIAQSGYHRIGDKITHITIVEKALGRPIPQGAEIHHVNGIRHDNDSQWNLVLCPNHAYHMLLERRTKALEACGNANFVRCQHCKRYDDISNGIYFDNRGTIYHTKCHSEYTRVLKLNKRRKERGEDPASPVWPGDINS